MVFSWKRTSLRLDFIWISRSLTVIGYLRVALSTTLIRPCQERHANSPPLWSRPFSFPPSVLRGRHPFSFSSAFRDLPLPRWLLPACGRFPVETPRGLIAVAEFDPNSS